jgi:hypothetical protein
MPSKRDVTRADCPVAKELERLQKERGITALGFSILARCSLPAVYATAQGRPSKISPRILAAFSRAGVDTADLVERYERYRKRFGADVVRRLSGPPLSTPLGTDVDVA